MTNQKHHGHHTNLNFEKSLLLVFTITGFFLTITFAHADNFSETDQDEFQNVKNCVTKNNPTYDAIVYNPQTDKPGNIEDQIIHDIDLLSGHSCSLVVYSNEYLELILKGIDSHGMHANILIDLTNDDSQNITTIQNVFRAIAQNPTIISSVSVGIDEIYDQTLTSEELGKYILKVKEEVKIFEIKVSSINDVNFWLDISQNKEIIDMVDFLIFDEFTYWLGLDSSNAITKTFHDYYLIKQNVIDKQIVIMTGWPHQSTDNRINAVASIEEQKKYIGKFAVISKEQNIKYYIFEAFDQVDKKNKTYVDIKIDKGLELPIAVTVGNINQAHKFLDKIQQEVDKKINLQDFAIITTHNSDAEKFFGVFDSERNLAGQVDKNLELQNNSSIPIINPLDTVNQNNTSITKQEDDKKIHDLLLVIMIGASFIISIAVVNLLKKYFEIKDTKCQYN